MKKQKILQCFKFALSIGLLLFLVQRFNIRFTTILQQVTHPLFIVLDFFIPIIFIQFFSINRWKVFLKIQGIEETYWTLLKINLISLAQGMVLPSSQGFDVFRMYHIERLHPEKKGQAGGTVIVERIIGLILLVAFAVVCLPFVAGKIRNAYKSIYVLSIIVAGVGFGLVFVRSQWIYRLYAEFHFKNAFLEGILEYIRKLHHCLMTFPYRSVLVSSIPYIAGFQFFCILSVYLLFKAFNCDLSLVDNMAMYPIIAILSIVPLTIGGFGVREGFFVYFYSELGVDADIAVTVSLMNYLILTVFPAAIGGIFWVFDICKPILHKSNV